MIGVANRCEPNAAIAEQNSADPMPGRRLEFLIPHRLTIIMRMDVDPTGRHQQPICLNLSLSWADLAANLGDLAVFQCDVPGVAGCTGAIDDRAASDHCI